MMGTRERGDFPPDRLAYIVCKEVRKKYPLKEVPIGEKIGQKVKSVSKDTL